MNRPARFHGIDRPTIQTHPVSSPKAYRDYEVAIVSNEKGFGLVAVVKPDNRSHQPPSNPLSALWQGIKFLTESFMIVE